MKLLLNILVIIGMLSISDNLFACSCVGERTVREEIKHSDAVLVGTIIDKYIITLTDASLFELFPPYNTPVDSSINRITFARYNLLVQDVYKGKITNDTVMIYTGLGGGDCGVRFEVGKKYIIYGEEETYYVHINNGIPLPKRVNAYWTNICTRTTAFFQKEIDEIESFAKKKILAINEDNVSTNISEVPPVYKNGGDIGLQKFITTNLRYPKSGECLNGKVYVEFTVDSLGRVRNVKIKKGLSRASNEEAIRVVRMLSFTPGTRLGKPIDMQVELAINFTLE